MSSQPYIVSARKYRPATFQTVVGQKSLTETLKNAIATNRIGQAYLFCGPRGVGKTSCARIFAKTINCLHPTDDGEACGECDNCRAIDSSSSFNVIELDAASNNGVDHIRNLTEQVQIPPQLGNFRVFIIDEVHMLSSSAFNAFLKTLEEPPKYAVFILATTEKHKVLPTILSRCQVFDFKRITVNDIAEHLAHVAARENIQAEPSALNVIARKADGAMRDALSIFDQVAASTQGNITYQATLSNLNVLDYDYYFRLVDCFRTSDVAEALLIYKKIRELGFDSQFFINGLADHIRDLMVAADPRTLSLLEAADEIAVKYNNQAGSLPLEWYYTSLRLLNECDRDYRTASNKRLLVELLLIRLCQLLKPATPPFDSVDYLPPLDNPFPGATATAPAIKAVDSKTNHEPTTELNLTPPPSHRRRGMVSHTGTISLSEATSATSSASETQPNNQPYTSDTINEGWKEFISQNPKLHILTAAMRKSFPKQIDDDMWVIECGQGAEAQAFEDALPNIVGTLRQKASNDNIRLTIKIIENATTPSRISDPEFLASIISKNKILGEAIQLFDCEMA